MSDSKSKGQDSGRKRELTAPEPTPSTGAGDPPEDRQPVTAPVHLYDDYWQPRPAAPKPDVKVAPVPPPAPPEPVVEVEPPPDLWARPSISTGSDNARATLRPFFDFYGA